MEKESFLGTIVAVVMAAVILSVVLVPIVDSESSYYVGVDENNENPLTDMMFTYTEKPVTKTYSFYWNTGSTEGILRISGDYEYTGNLTTSQILIGTDAWSLVVDNGVIKETINGSFKQVSSKSNNSSGTFVRTITNGIVEGTSEPYKYLYYPDEFGIYANYDKYEYNTDKAYAVGSFGGISVITKAGEIQNQTAIPMVADVLTEGDEYTGVNYYPAPPEPEPEEESVEESLEVHAAYDGSLGAAAPSVGSLNPVAVENVSGGMVLNAATNPSNATLVGDLWYDVRSGNAIVTGVRDTSLTSITIPSSVTVNGTTYTVIGVGNGGSAPFLNMASLVSITIPDTLTHFGKIDPRTGNTKGVNGNSNDQICYGCTSLSTFSFSPSSQLQYIGDAVFYNCTALNLSALPSSLVYVGYSAFYNCTNVTISSVPTGVTELKGSCFYGTGISTFNAHNGITAIGNSVFSRCVSLTTVILPNGLTTISESLFSGCSELVSVTIPSNVTSIGNYAFSNCSKLTLSTLPINTTSIGTYAFSKCSSITLSSLPLGLSTIESGTFDGCTNVTFSSIPHGVTVIGYTAFQNCPNITISTLPDTLTSIQYRAFYGCSSMPLISIPESVTFIGVGAFYGCSSIIVSEIPSGVTELGGDTFGRCTSIRTMNLNNVEHIRWKVDNFSADGGTFAGCTALTSVTGHKLLYVGGPLSASTGHVQNGSDFSGCTNLTTVDFPLITQIGSSSFYGSGLRVADFPNVTYLGGYAFNDCRNLTSVNMPSLSLSKNDGSSFWSGCITMTQCNIPNVHILSNSSFDTCGELITLNVGTLSYVGERAFYNCSKLESVIDCSECTTIPNYAFFRCSAIPNILLGEGLTSIGNQAFQECSSWTITKDAPIYANTIGTGAFYKCTSIESLNLPNVTVLTSSSSWSVFGNCTSLTEAILPNVTALNGSSLTNTGPFAWSTNLKTIYAPKLETIGDYGLSQTGIESTKGFMDNVVTIGKGAFTNNEKLSELYIGPKTETVGSEIAIGYNLKTIIIDGNPTLANKWLSYGFSQVGVVVLGNPTFLGNWFSNNGNITNLEVLNFGETDIYPGAMGLPANKTVIKEKLEDVSMLQIKDHIGYYKHYKDDIEYKLLLVVPVFVGLGIVMALFSPAIRSRLT